MTAAGGTPGPRLTESKRIEAFPDGVLAIALTLLVLDLHSGATRGEFGHELAGNQQSYLAWLPAFPRPGSSIPSASDGSPSRPTRLRSSE